MTVTTLQPHYPLDSNHFVRMQEPYKKTMNQMAEKIDGIKNCRDGEPDPYIIIILTQL